MMQRASQRYALDYLIQRMWEIRDRILAGGQDSALREQLMLLRRVIAYAVQHRQRRALERSA